MNQTRRISRGLPGALLVMAVAMASTAAQAQEASAPVKSGARARRGVVLKDLRIEGRIQKPQAFYILQRSNLNFEGLELKNSFVPKIIKSVEQPPF
jgi:hypothetical protein